MTTYLLAVEGAHTSGGLPVGFSANSADNSGSGLPWRLPAGPNALHEQFDELAFTVSVIGTAGTTPTSWSLAARFEKKIPHTIGFQYQFPVWVPFDAFDMRSRVVEGVGWAGASHPVPDDGSYGIIADSNDGLGSALNIPVAGSAGMSPTATRVTVSRIVQHPGAGVSVHFLPTITGGDTTTRILATVTVAGKDKR